MSTFLTKSVLEAVKQRMKSQKLTYSQMAKRLSLSESGLKKILNARDLSMGKAERICEALGLSLLDLIKGIEPKGLTRVNFTHDQEDYFLKDEKHFFLYWLLVYERRSLDAAMDVLSLRPEETERILLKLDRLNLLKVLPQGKLKLPRPVGIVWDGKSRFVKALYRKWGMSLFERGLHEIGTEAAEDSYFRIRYLKMSPSTYSEFRSDLKSLDEKYSHRATLEMRLQLENLVHARWLTVADKHSWLDD